MPNEEEYGMSRNFADVSQTITVLTEIYWDLRFKVRVTTGFAYNEFRP